MRDVARDGLAFQIQAHQLASAAPNFAAVSDTAEASVQAVDISESQLIAQVLADERARLAAERAQTADGRAAGAATPEPAV